MKIGTLELIVILLIAFLVLGPERTVLYTRKLGKSLRTLKIYINSFTDDLKETVVEPLQEIQEPLNELKKPLEDAVRTVQQPVDELNTTLVVNESKLRLRSSAAGKPAAGEAEEELEEALPADTQ